MKANDIYTLLGLITRSHADETLDQQRIRTGLSISSIHRSLKSLKKAKLVIETVNGNEPIYRNIKEFLLHGFSYVFPEEKGKLARGFVTGIDASSLKYDFALSDYPVVWAHPEGDTKGYSVKPLNTDCLELIVLHKMDEKLYELLALLDILRIGQRREIEGAKSKINEILDNYEQ